MKRNKNIVIIIIVLLFSISGFSQKKDTLYFDKSWKKTDRKNHKFYRLLPSKTIGELSLLIDYYKNGNMQMQAYVKSNNQDEFVGDGYWYTEDGFDAYSSYERSKTNQNLVYYHPNGKLWKKIPYKNGKRNGTVNVYDYKNRLRESVVYEKGKVVSNKVDSVKRRSILYWRDSKNIAKETHYGKNRTILKEDYYSVNGKIIKSYTKSDFIRSDLKKGIHYEEKTKNGFVVDFETDYEAFQSKIIPLKGVDYININKGYRNFIRENGTNHQYLEYNISYDKNIPEKSFRFKLSEPKENKDKKSELISIKKIKKQSVAKLLKTLFEKQWESSFKEKEYSSSDPMEFKAIYKQYNSSVFVSLKLKYDDNRSRGFGSYYASDDQEKKKWRVDQVNFYTINIIVLNNNHPIVALSQKDDLKYYIIPLKDGSFRTNFKQDLIIQNKSNLNKEIALDIVKYGNTDIFYKTVRKNKKNYIANEFNEILIDKAYDSIKRKGQFIIGENAKYTDVYNLKLEKLVVKNLRKLYYDRSNLQVLSDNETFFINSLGDKTKRQQIHYSFCGTVCSTSFLIEDGIKKEPKIRVYYGGMTRKHFEQTVSLSSLKNKQDITFLNKTKKDGYDDNSSFVEGYVNRTAALLVKDKNKYGLYVYSKDVLEGGNVKEILPIEYDGIELKNPLIILNKNKKFGIFKDKKGLIYKSFGRIQVNFMRYEKLDGEKGWIDINSFKEYADK